MMAQNVADRWVMVPGTLCTADVFAPLLGCLGVAAGRCQFVVPDAPRVEDYDARLRAAVTGGEIVCGFSLGALILAHNLDALARAKAVVLLASNPFPDPAGNRAGREALRDRILRGGARDWVVESWCNMSTTPDPALRDTVAAMAEACMHLIAAQTELAASRPGAADGLARCDLPLVFITGAEDRLPPPDPIRNIASQAPRADLRVLAGLGHFALLEAPERVARAISDGLAAVTEESPTI